MALTRWNIDTSHSGVHFVARHMVVSKVRGSFERWQGTVDFDPERPEASKIAVTIEAASITTREPKRDEHLRSADFFDVEKFPMLTFNSTKVAKTGDHEFRVTGDLSVHGVTRAVTFDAELLGTGKDPWGGERIGFSGHTSVNRKDFGLHWNQVLEAGGVLVGDKIEIGLDVQAVKTVSTKAA
jgi:polyisoprenoid-binding protein YceI